LLAGLVWLSFTRFVMHSPGGCKGEFIDSDGSPE
jgi:hypothetical protein